jgi:hypothetical protein
VTERELIVKFLLDKTPVVLDIDNQVLKYDRYNIYYRIYKYIKELEEEINKNKGDVKNEN